MGSEWWGGGLEGVVDSTTSRTTDLDEVAAGVNVEEDGL